MAKTYLTGITSGNFTVFTRTKQRGGAQLRSVKKDFSMEDKVDWKWQIGQAVLDVNGHFDKPQDTASELGSGN